MTGLPGGSVVYEHELTNTGNITEPITITTSNDQGIGWSSLVYLDDGDGVPELGGQDILIPQGTTLPAPYTAGLLTPLTQTATQLNHVTLWVKVSVPLGATAPTQNVTTLTATPLATVSAISPATGSISHSPVSRTDTTIVGGPLQLTKKQALDLDCDGVFGETVSGLTEIGFTQDDIDSLQTSGTVGDAIPGSCIVYEITATNLGVTSVTNVVINDVTPPNTTMVLLPAAAAPTIVGTPGVVVLPLTGVNVSTPGAGLTGSISTTVLPVTESGFTITSGGKAVLTFWVKVN